MIPSGVLIEMPSNWWDFDSPTGLASYHIKQIVERQLKDEAKLARVKELLENSLKAYQAGDKVAGGSLLNEIQDIVAPNRYKEYEQRKGVPG